jgi:thioredoxin-dependent peroxiredoxin
MTASGTYTACKPSCIAGVSTGAPSARPTMPASAWQGHTRPVVRTPSPAECARRISDMLPRVTTAQNGLPQVGQPAPAFTLASSDGGDVSLSDFKGKQSVVLYFYPRDDTPGCTTEACSFRDLRTVFHERGAEILGVSTDSIASHKKFQKKFGLTFPLLADPDHAVAEQYGVWQLRKFMGREYMGIARTTFVIGQDGTIKAVFPNVKVDGHADQVLNAL